MEETSKLLRSTKRLNDASRAKRGRVVFLWNFNRDESGDDPRPTKPKRRYERSDG